MKLYFRVKNYCHKWLCLDKFAVLGIAFCVATATSLTARAQTTAEILDRYTATDDVVVKVYFNELSVAQQISKSYEPRESRYELGYLVLQEQKSEILRLLQFREQLDFTVVVDENATATEQLKNLGLGLQKKSPQSTNPKASPNNLTERQLGAASSFVGIPGFACYRTVEETFASAIDIVAQYPALASWTDVGDSWEKQNGLGGYDLNVLRLTNQAVAGPKPTIFITSAIHAREYTTAELMTRFAEKLVTDYGVDADTTWILDHTDIRLMLVTNPDGRKKAETGLLWRKNTNRNYCSATSNNRGADLNRNFTFGWNCCNGSSSSQCNQTYRGAAPASEPETQAVIGQLASIFPDARGPDIDDATPLDTPGMYLDIHSSGRLLLWPWGFTANAAPNGTQLQTLGRKLAFFNGHSPQQSIGLYPTDGTTTSYAYGTLGLAAYTYELGTEFFESCNYFENTLLPDNLASLMYALKVVRAPFRLPAGPEGYGIALAPSGPSGVPAGTNVNLQITFNDARYNNSNGSEPAQAIANAEYYIDIAPWEPGAAAVAVAMSAADFSFNSSVEVAQAVIDTTTLAAGRHTVYSRARDAAGNWGVVSAAFLDIDNDATLPTILFEDDFENDRGWLTNPTNSDTATTGQWARANPEPTSSGGNLQLGDAVSGDFNLVTGALAGTSAGTQDIDGGVTSIRSPDIDLPLGASNIELSVYSYLAHLDNATADDFLRVSVVGSVSGRQQVLQEVGDANQDNASWVQSTVSLDNFAGETVHLLIEAADAAGGSLVEAGVDDVTITASLPTTGNTAPRVDAGAERVVSLPSSLFLNATVVDDGLPSPPATVTTAWSLVSGPGNVIFGDTTAVDTNASFTAAGIYVLRLDANDGELTSRDDVTITVREPTLACAIEEDFESGLGGWQNSAAATCSTGSFIAGTPTAVTNGNVLTQVGGDHTSGSGAALFSAANTSAGSNDIDGGQCIAESPLYAVTADSDLSVWYFHGQRDSGDDAGDFFNLELSLDGGSSWSSIAANGDQVSNAAWTQATATVPAGASVKLRISAADGTANGDLIEAGLDDLSICPAP